MSHQLNRLALAFMAAFMLVALTAGYWGVVERASLLARRENPRRLLTERRRPRGTIYDRAGAVLAESAGEPGDYYRLYPYPSAAPVTGYVSAFYGTAGVEAVADGVLHGDAGRETLSTYWQDAVLGNPPPGRDVRLSLDLQLQSVADDALGEQTGAVVLLDARTGEILVLASHPTFDPNQIDTQWAEINADPRALLFNRATQALYPPGGAIAPLIAGAALEAGLMRLDEPVPNASAAVTLPEDLTLGCRVSTQANVLTLSTALAYGCPRPFAELGQKLGAARFERVLADFRVFEAPPIAIPTTSANPADFGDDLAALAVGQGSISITPLHLALITAALAREGQMPAPQLLSAEQDPAGGWQVALPATHSIAALPPEYANQVKAVIADGFSAIAVMGSGGRRVAWFMGFAPFADSHYAVAVLLESGDVIEAKLIGRRVLDAATAESR